MIYDGCNMLKLYLMGFMDQLVWWVKQFHKLPIWKWLNNHWFILKLGDDLLFFLNRH